MTREVEDRFGTRSAASDARGTIPRRSRVVVWLASLGALATVTLGMLAFRADLDKAHVTLVYLLVVLVGSGAGGRVVGFTLAGLAFLAFDIGFLPPYGTLVINNPLDWLVLVAFLATSLMAAQLLTRAQERAEEARARAAEVERLSTLGVETLNAVRAEDALRAIATVIRSTLEVDRCEIYITWNEGSAPVLAARSDEGTVIESTDHPPLQTGESLLTWVNAHGDAAAERLDGTLHVPARVEVADLASEVRPIVWADFEGVRVLIAPLRVRERTVGVLRLVRQQGMNLVPEQQLFLDALTYYAALGVERARLTADAEHVEAMREADRLKNALLATVSHDLRTPLTTIKALARVVADDGAPPGDRRVQSIEEEADRLTAFVADLLDLSRLQGSALRLDIAVNTADDLIGAALTRVSGVAAAHPIHVHHAADAPVLIGRFDFVHALRALVNLLENAAKYSPPGSTIELSATRESDMLVFTVADRGPGVPDAERERIFEPFYRPPGVPPDVRGAGLGLAIARGLALAQQGTVRYAARDGGGSLFSLVLPAEQVASKIFPEF